MPPIDRVNEVQVTIKAIGGAHTTIQGWHDATDDDCVAGFGAGIYANPCSPTGLLEDEDYDAALSITGATTDNEHYRTLSVTPGHHHLGKFPFSQAGARIEEYLQIDEAYFVLEWAIVQAGGSMSDFSSINYNSGNDGLSRKVIVDVSAAGHVAIRIDAGNGSAIEVHNCILIARRAGTGRSIQGGFQDDGKVKNCTGLATNAATDHVFFGSMECKNCIGIGTNGGLDFDSTVTGEYNLSGDSSAPYTSAPVFGNTDGYVNDFTLVDSGGDFVNDGVKIGMIVQSDEGLSYVTAFDSGGTDITVNDAIFPSQPLGYEISEHSWGGATTTIFEDDTNEAEDLHLADGSTMADGVGADLSAELEVADLTEADDIDGETRPDGPWDIGADEVVAAGVTVSMTLGQVTVTSYAFTIVEGIEVDLTLAQVNVTGYAFDVVEGIEVDLTAGSVVVTPYDFTVDLTLDVDVTLAQVTVTSYAFDVVEGIEVDLTLAAIVSTPYAFTIDLTAAGVAGPYRVAAAGSFSAGAVAADSFHAGAEAGGSFVAGAVIGQAS